MIGKFSHSMRAQSNTTKIVEYKVLSRKKSKRMKEQNFQKQRVKQLRGLVLIKHLPRGFFEEELRNYFEQFGKVTRMRLVRSRRTGGSKGFAFIEFRYPAVAQIAAETMHNYFMFKKIIKAIYIPPDKQKFDYFRSTMRQVKHKSGKLVWVSSRTANIQHKVKQYNNWTNKIYQKRINRNLLKIKKIGDKYSCLGIDFTKIIVMPEQVTMK